MLLNPITRFLSGISLEIYLSHMVIYRVLEKIGVTHYFGDDIMSYMITSLGTLGGVIVFAMVVHKGLEKLRKPRLVRTGQM